MSHQGVALVTGGSQGLGAGAVRALLERGHDVAVLDIKDPAEMEASLSLTEEQHDRRVTYHRFDLADLTSHGTVLDEVIDQHGSVDFLVNNAGVGARPLTDLLELSPEAFDHNLDVNLRGTFFFAQTVARWMTAHPADVSRGIVFVSSINADVAAQDRAQYCVSKAGLGMVAQLFATRLAEEGIPVFDIRPGMMETPLTASLKGSYEQMLAGGHVPMGRWGTAEDFGQLVATLASGGLPYMTGQTLWVAGGQQIRRSALQKQTAAF